MLADLIEAIRLLAVHLSPFIPDGAGKIANQVGFELGPVADDGVCSLVWNGSLADCTLPKASPIFPKFEVEVHVEA